MHKYAIDKTHTGHLTPPRNTQHILLLLQHTCLKAVALNLVTLQQQEIHSTNIPATRNTINQGIFDGEKF